MDRYIEVRGQTYWIANPSDPRENFADAWEAEPERKLAFDDWLDTARKDFERAGETEDLAQIIDLLSPDSVASCWRRLQLGIALALSLSQLLHVDFTE